MAWDWKFHANAPKNAETNDLSLDLTKAGNKNVEADKIGKTTLRVQRISPKTS